MNAIQPYYSLLSESDKRLISTEFEKPDSERVLDCSIHRIIVATDAMGMGIDNPDIQFVVQWRVPPSMGALMQRAGRAARGKGVYGRFVWLVPAWCFGERIEHLPPRSSKKRLTEREKRSVLPRGIWELINSSTCVRRGILEFFGENCPSATPQAGIISCCGKCAGNKAIVPTSKAGQSIRVFQSQKHIAKAVKLALLEWRETKAAEVLSPTLITATLAQAILPDKAVTIISRAGTEITSLSSLAYAVNGEWGFLSLYGDDVLKATRDACLRATLQKLKLGG